MGQGQEREEGIIRSELVLEEFVHSCKSGHEVGVSDDDSLGVSGGSTSIHDAVYFIPLWHTRLCFFLRDCDGFSAFAEFLDGEDGNVWAGILDLLEKFRLGLPVVNHELDGGGIREDIRKDWEEIGVGENSDTLWLVEGVCEAGFTKSVVCGCDGHRDRSAGKGHQLPVDTELHGKMSTPARDAVEGKRVPRRGVDVENVTPLEAEIRQTSTNSLGDLAKFGEREILELAELEIRPFLLLFDLFTPYNLGDLLFLEMSVDDVAVPNSVLGSVRAVNVYEDVVDGVHAVHGACCELPVGDEEVPADPSLALLGLGTDLYGTRTKVDHNALE